MSFATRNNRARYSIRFVTFRDDVINETTTYAVYGLGIKYGRYGETPYVDIYPAGEVPEDVYRLNLPKWMMNDINRIMSTDADMMDINAGKVGAKFNAITGKNGDTHMVEWVDL